jgi:hypothetical protein
MINRYHTHINKGNNFFLLYYFLQIGYYRRRKEDASDEYPVWIGTLVPRFLLLKKCLRLDLLMLTPMGVPNPLLITMWVLHLLLIPMGVLLVLPMWMTRRKKMKFL